MARTLAFVLLVCLLPWTVASCAPPDFAESNNGSTVSLNAGPITLEGIIYAEGGSLADGYTVRLLKGNTFIKSTQTSAIGSFLFKGLSAGSYKVEIFDLSGNLIHEKKGINLKEGLNRQRVEIWLTESPSSQAAQEYATIEGDVSLKDGTILPKHMLDLKTDTGTGAFRQTMTNEAGHYRFSGVPMGQYYLDVRSPEGEILKQNQPIRISATDKVYTIDVQISKDAPSPSMPHQMGDVKGKGQISVTVTTSDDDPRMYRVRLEGPVVTETQNTNVEGWVVFRNIPYGEYRVSVFSEDGRLISADEVATISLVNPSDMVKVILSPQITGTVSSKQELGQINIVLEGRKPNARYRVVLLDKDNQAVRYKWSSATNGTVSFGNLPLATYRVQIYSEDTKRIVHDGELISISPLFPTDERTIHLGETASKQGKITVTALNNGQPNPSAKFILAPKTDPAQTVELHVDRQGNAEFKNLAFQSYVLTGFYMNRSGQAVQYVSQEITLTEQQPEFSASYDLNRSTSQPEKPVQVTVRFVDMNLMPITDAPAVCILKGDKNDYSAQKTMQNGQAVFEDVPSGSKLLAIVTYKGKEYSNNFPVMARKNFTLDVINSSDEGSSLSASAGSGVFEGVLSDGGSGMVYRLELVGIDINKKELGWSTAEGRFKFVNLPDGTYRLRVYCTSSQRLVSNNTNVTISELFPTVFKEVRVGGCDNPASMTPFDEACMGMLEGSVQFASGEAQAGTYLVLEHQNSDAKFFRWTEEDGTFRFDNLCYGTYHLKIYKMPERELLKQDIEITVSELMPLVSRNVMVDLSIRYGSGDDLVTKGTTRSGAGTVKVTVSDKMKTYQVVLMDNGVQAKKMTENGVVEFSNVRYGSYTVQLYKDQNLLAEKALNFTGLFDPHQVHFEIPVPATPKVGSIRVALNQNPPGDADKYRVLLRDSVNGQRIAGKDMDIPINSSGLFEDVALGSYLVEVYPTQPARNTEVLARTEVTLTDLFPHREVDVELSAGQASATIQEEEKEEVKVPKGTVEVQVVRANSPQNFFSVVLKSRQYQQIQSTNPNTGIVTFENVPYDNYEVVVRDISSGKVIKEGVGVALDAEYRRVAIPLEAVPEKQPEPKTEEGRLEIRVTREGATDALNTYIVMLVSENRKKIINHTDSFGQVSFSDLPLGTYQITVLEPGSHEILKDDIQVTLTKLFPERVIQISLSAPAEKPVEEVDPASIPKGTFDGRIVCSVDDASCPTCTEKIYRLELVNSETKKRYYRWTNHGTFRFEDLPYGDYTLQVYSSPMEQVCCDKPIAVRISELFPNPTRVIKDLNNACCPQPATTRDDNGNKPKFGSVFISVKGKGDAKPPFEVALLSRSNTQNFRYKQPTNKYGDVFFDNVGFDVYYVYIYEGTLPDGRLLSSDYTLTVSELDPHIRKTYEVGAEKKAPKTGTLQLTVTCPDGSYKAPFKITLRGASNPASQIYTKVTDDDGRVFFEKLSIDRYRVEAYADPFTDKFIQGEHQIEISELSLNKIMTLAICGEKKKKDVGDLEVTVKSRNAGKCAAPFYIRLVNLRNSHTVDNIKASSSAPGSVRLDGDVLSGGSAFRMTFTNLEKSVYRVEVYADESRLKLLDKSINVAVDAVRTEVEVEVCDKPVKKGGEIAGKIQKPCRDTEIYIVDLIKDNKLVASDTTGNSDNFKFRFPNLEFGNYCLRVYLAIDDPYRYVEKFECIDVTLSELLPVAWRDVKIDCPSQQTKGSLMVMIEDCQNIGEYRVVITNQSTKKVKTSDASDNRSSSPRRANLKFEGLDLGVYAVTLYSNNVEQANVSKLLGDSVTVALTETFPHQAVRFNTCEKPKPEDPRRIVLRINLEDKPELKPEKYRVELTDGENPPFEYQSIKFTDDKGEVVFSNLNLTTYRLFVYDTFGNRILSGEDCLEVTLSNRSPSWLIEITLRPDNAAEARSSRSRYERSYGGNRTTTNSDTPSRCQKLPLYP